VVSNCTFINNTAKGLEDNNAGGYGGAIATSKIPLTIIGSLFVGNRAESQGSFTEYSSRGGAIYISLTASVEISETVFQGNGVKSGQGAALFATHSSLTFLQAAFLRNRVYSSTEVKAKGGALALASYSNSSIASCIFEGNMALASTTLMSDGLGGALYLQSPIDTTNSVIIQDSLFDLNQADWGGAIYFDSQNFIEINSTTFRLNGAIQGGGAIYFAFANRPLANNLQFISNTANNGGGIFLADGHSSLWLHSMVYDGNQAIQNGGALYLLDSNVDIQVTNSTFRGNTASLSGGAIYLNNNNLNFTLTNVVAIGNVAQESGGAVYSKMFNHNLIIANSEFSTNIARSGGGVFLGLNHQIVSIRDTSFFRCQSIGGGGGLYSSQSSQLLDLSNCSFVECGGDSGGALASMSNVTLMKYCRIQSTKSSWSVLVTGDATTVDILNTLFLKNLGPVSVTGSSVSISGSWFISNIGITGGALYLKDIRRCNITDCEFHENVASFGAAIFLDSADQLIISAVLLRGNIAGSGAVSLSHVTSLSLTNSTFLDNQGSGDGGAIWQSDVTGIVRSNVFFNNSVEFGGGSALFLANNTISILNNIFSENRVTLGGGVVCWVASDMLEPTGLGINTTNSFLRNSASYGPQWATEITQIVTPFLSYNVTNYELDLPFIFVTMLDYYGQVITSDFGTDITAKLSGIQTCSNDAVLGGGTLVKTIEGVANFTALTVKCSPGGSAVVQFSTLGFLLTTVKVYFRECRVGEYSTAQVCVFCESGTYSLTHDTANLDQDSVCHPCPPHTTSCFASSLVLPAGFWRISPQSDDIFPCPYGKFACRGGELTGDESCLEGYEGPLCGICQPGFSLQSSTQRCVVCSGSSAQDISSLILLLVIAFILLFAGYYFLFGSKSRKQIHSIEDLVWLITSRLGIQRETQKETMEFVTVVSRRLKARIKVYLTMYQILSCLPFVLDFIFPYPIDVIVAALSIVNISITRSQVVSCSNPSYDFISILVVDTLYPIGVVICLSVIRSLHLLILSHRSSPLIPRSLSKISSYYFKVIILFIYIILPSVTTKIFQTFR
jgi:predicted outer membrane repeat protein